MTAAAPFSRVHHSSSSSPWVWVHSQHKARKSLCSVPCQLSVGNLERIVGLTGIWKPINGFLENCSANIFFSCGEDLFGAKEANIGSIYADQNNWTLGAIQMHPAFNFPLFKWKKNFECLLNRNGFMLRARKSRHIPTNSYFPPTSFLPHTYYVTAQWHNRPYVWQGICCRIPVCSLLHSRPVPLQNVYCVQWAKSVCTHTDLCKCLAAS